MNPQIGADALTEEKIISYDGGKKYAHLVKTESGIVWFDFAKQVYKQSHSIPSIITYSKGLCMFQAFLRGQASTKYLAKTISALVTELNQPNVNGLVYTVFNDFTTWLDTAGYKPASVFVWVASVRKLFAFLEIEIDDKKFKNKVSMAKVRPLREEYPTNEVIRKVADSASFTIRILIHMLCDYGFEPIDLAQLKPKYFKFDEDPVRCVIKREKTDEPLEAFFSKQTADGLKQLITVSKLEPDDYIFARDYTPFSVSSIRQRYNAAVVKAGQHEKIENHRYSKLHLKIFKKRWFSIAIGAGVPEFIIQGMLGRSKYLDEYNAQPLEKRREFAKKILKAVSIYAREQDKQEVIQKASEILGMKIDENMLKQLREALVISGQLARLPEQDKARLLSPSGDIHGGDTAQ